MPKPINLAGLRFGRLVAIRSAPPIKPGRPLWECVCDCGSKTIVGTWLLRSAQTRSCGCLQRERSSESARVHQTRHGLTDSPEWKTWIGMLSRCRNKNATGYNRYGGRGISVCERWSTFENFLADMGKRPSKTHTLDRKEKNGNYEPDNCKWATKTEQANNRRDNVMVTIAGSDMTIRNAIRQFGNGISLRQARRRIEKGWPHEEAISRPPGPTGRH